MQQKLSEEHKKFLRDYFLKKTLSKSEVEVVILALQGYLNKEIADMLCVAEKTIKFHLGNSYKKLNISRRSQLIWTLPLADFVGVKDKSDRVGFHSGNQGSNSEEDDIIPRGASTVSDLMGDKPL